MCITIPSSANVNKARPWIVWQWLAASPLRLYLVGGAMLLAVAQAMTLAGIESTEGWGRFNLYFALLPGVLLGRVFSVLPRLLKVTPLSYTRFAFLFFLLVLSQVSFHLYAALDEAQGLFYLLSLGTVWGLSLQAVRGLLRFSYSPSVRSAAVVAYLLAPAAVLGLMTAIGLVAGRFSLLTVNMGFVVLPLYLSVSLVLLYPHRRREAPRPA